MPAVQVATTIEPAQDYYLAEAYHQVWGMAVPVPGAACLLGGRACSALACRLPDAPTPPHTLQQYLSRGGRFNRPQSAEKGATDKIRCYG